MGKIGDDLTNRNYRYVCVCVRERDRERESESVCVVVLCSCEITSKTKTIVVTEAWPIVFPSLQPLQHPSPYSRCQCNPTLPLLAA